MIKKEDSIKVKITKQKIKEAFLELYKYNSIEKITIKQLTDKTGFNRGTFYIHYIDIYDLLEQIENEFIKDISAFIHTAFNDERDLEDKFRDPNMGFLQVLKYIKNKRNYSEVLLRENSTFIKKFRNFIRGIFEEYILNRGFDAMNIEYVLFANMGIIIHWIETDFKIKEEELIQKIGNFMFKGPLNMNI